MGRRTNPKKGPNGPSKPPRQNNDKPPRRQNQQQGPGPDPGSFGEFWQANRPEDFNNYKSVGANGQGFEDFQTDSSYKQAMRQLFNAGQSPQQIQGAMGAVGGNADTRGDYFATKGGPDAQNAYFAAVPGARDAYLQAHGMGAPQMTGIYQPQQQWDPNGGVPDGIPDNLQGQTYGSGQPPQQTVGPFQPGPMLPPTGSPGYGQSPPITPPSPYYGQMPQRPPMQRGPMGTTGQPPPPNRGSAQWMRNHPNGPLAQQHARQQPIPGGQHPPQVPPTYMTGLPGYR